MGHTITTTKYTHEIAQAKPFIPRADRERLILWYKKILTSGQLINGAFTKTFEKEMARSCGVAHAVAFNSCTSALQAVLEYIDVRDKKVIVPANTFIATSNAVLFAGGIPTIVDIGEHLLMDEEAMKKNIDTNTKAVIMVHIAGFIHPEIERIRTYLADRNVYLLEDASHAHGASQGGVAAGSFGYAGVFSFYATKVLTTGVGGILTTHDPKLAAFARSVRFHGEDTTRGIQDRIGRDSLMTEMQAALGLCQLRRLPEIIHKRMRIAKAYDAALEGHAGMRTITLPPHALSGYYKYPVIIENPLDAPTVRNTLEHNAIRVGAVYWPPIHLQPAYRKMFGYTEGDFPVAEAILKNVITLPMFPEMTDEEVGRVIECLTHV